MKKRQYRFKTQFLAIGGVYNIPGLVVCSGHGYQFQTFCCKHCGEIYIVEIESIGNHLPSLSLIAGEKKCPNCNALLGDSLVEYPENIFYKGRLLKNLEAIDRTHFDDTFLQEIYLFN